MVVSLTFTCQKTKMEGLEDLDLSPLRMDKTLTTLFEQWTDAKWMVAKLL